MYHLREETAEDWWEVEALYDLCFAPGREALSSYRLRDGVDPVSQLSLVARDGDGILSGAIRYWPVMIQGTQTRHRALLLGPVAVHPTRQGEGLGGHLIRKSLLGAQTHPARRVMLVGDASYYARFGFARLDHVVMPPPTNPDRVLGYRLDLGYWDNIAGTVERVAPVGPCDEA